jgi:polyhydroxybutyrate depolymerase
VVAISALVLVGAIAVDAVAVRSSGGMARGDTTIRLRIDGEDRSYQLHLPPDADGTPRPVIVELHGGGGRATTIERLTGLTTVTDRRGWIVVAPDGIDHQWDDGRPGVNADQDDVAFIAAVLDDLAGRTSVDLTRVFATGISNGAMMSGRLACELSGRIAAVAQVAGTLGTDASVACHPGRPVSVLVISGTADPLVPFEGGDVRVFGRTRGTVVGAKAYVADWVARDGLGGVAPAVTTLDPDTTIYSYEDPAPGSVVAFYRIDGGGHTWPGGWQYLPSFIVGRTTRTFSASAVIVDFFAGAPERP